MNFTLRGRPFTVTPEQVVETMAGVTPQSIARYRVQVGERWYPPKQVIACLTELPSIAFTTQDAYRLLERLGFTVVRI